MNEEEYETLMRASVILPPLPDVDLDDTETLRMREYATKAALLERKACWDSINKWIVPGELQGQGWDQTAQRNGMILAANQISQRGLP